MQMSQSLALDQSTLSAEASTVVSKAALRAAERLGINARELAVIIGVSEANLSRMKRQTYQLAQASKPFELAVLFVRLFRSLDAVTGGDEVMARAWLRNDNLVLGRRPIDALAEVTGLTAVLAYLDARRALV
jgi:uncharacterized protein (DUF2384 family)